jgi:hypothetical protein
MKELKEAMQMVAAEVDKRIRQYLEGGRNFSELELQLNLEDHVWIELICEKQNISKEEFMLNAIRDKIGQDQMKLFNEERQKILNQKLKEEKHGSAAMYKSKRGTYPHISGLCSSSSQNKKSTAQISKSTRKQGEKGGGKHGRGKI